MFSLFLGATAILLLLINKGFPFPLDLLTVAVGATIVGVLSWQAAGYNKDQDNTTTHIRRAVLEKAATDMERVGPEEFDTVNYPVQDAVEWLRDRAREPRDG